MCNDIILPENENSATYRTDISGWVSANGKFFGKDERLARWEGSTHRKCENCGELIVKSSYCRRCQATREYNKYKSFPIKEWDEISPITTYAHNNERYFWSWEDVADYLADINYDQDEESTTTVEKLHLVHCEEIGLKPVDLIDYWESDLPDDFEESELPSNILEALDKLNSLIKSTPSKIYLPRDIAVNIEGKENLHLEE